MTASNGLAARAWRLLATSLIKVLAPCLPLKPVRVTTEGLAPGVGSTGVRAWSRRAIVSSGWSGRATELADEVASLEKAGPAGRGDTGQRTYFVVVQPEADAGPAATGSGRANASIRSSRISLLDSQP